MTVVWCTENRYSSRNARLAPSHRELVWDDSDIQCAGLLACHVLADWLGTALPGWAGYICVPCTEQVPRGTELIMDKPNDRQHDGVGFSRTSSTVSPCLGPTSDLDCHASRPEARRGIPYSGNWPDVSSRVHPRTRRRRLLQFGVLCGSARTCPL